MQHWGVGLLTSLLFFGSVLFHELAHSVVAQHYKIRVVSITLFVFGGLARIARDPSKAIQEFNIAIAGPLASGFLAGLFLATTLLFPSSQMTRAPATWLWQTNARARPLQSFAGFPLDGGRIFARNRLGDNERSFARDTRRWDERKARGLRIDGRRRILLSEGDWQSGIWLAFIGWSYLRGPGKRCAGRYAPDALRPQRR